MSVFSSFPGGAFPAGSELDPAYMVSININGNSFNVWDEGREELFARSGSSTQRAIWKCRVPWTQRIALAAALLGGGTPVAGTTLYLDGFPYPDNPAWVVQTVQTKAEGLMVPGSKLCEYQRAELTTTFGVPDFNIGTPNTGEQELDFCSNSIPLNQQTSTFQWSDDGDDIPATQAPVLRFTTIQFRQSKYNLAVLPVQTISSCLDCVNSDTFFGAAPGFVLFKGCRSRRNITASGVTNWSVDYSFEVMSSLTNGWNSLYKASTGTWVAFKIKATGAPYFPSTSFNALMA